MLRRTPATRKGYEAWPWPAKLPFKQHWYRHYTAGPSGSISREVRNIQQVGDIAVVATLAFIAYRVYGLYTSDTYKTRLRHTTGMPPALVAQEFDFENPANNRKVSREKLDEFRSEFASNRASQTKLESWIFKY